MSRNDLHPLARQVIDEFASVQYFRSIRLANALAERHPEKCVQWALNLVQPFVKPSTPEDLINRTLSSIHRAIESPSANELSLLDELSWASWCSAPCNNAKPYAQRAVARLGWASMFMICVATKSHFESNHTGLHLSADDDEMIRRLANQCGMAVDMMYTDTNDGRLMVAASFSREMASMR